MPSQARECSALIFMITFGISTRILMSSLKFQNTPKRLKKTVYISRYIRSWGL